MQAAVDSAPVGRKQVVPVFYAGCAVHACRGRLGYDRRMLLLLLRRSAQRPDVIVVLVVGVLDAVGTPAPQQFYDVAVAHPAADKSGSRLIVEKRKKMFSPIELRTQLSSRRGLLVDTIALPLFIPDHPEPACLRPIGDDTDAAEPLLAG